MSSTTTNWILKLFDKVSSPLKTIEKNTKRTTQSGDRLKSSFKRISAINFYGVGQGIESLNQQLQSAVKPGVEFQSGLAEVEAITGVTGEKLEALGEKARKSALQFGGKAGESLDTYKTLLSRLGPAIAKSPEALEKMEHNVRTLSKTMGGDATASVDALTTALLQYGVDLSDPIKAQKTMGEMMNVMAAGAKEGAAEVPGISQALKVAGVQASQSNVSFVATNAALQALAAGGKEGAQAGTALRNILGKIAGEDIIPKEAADKLRMLGVNMDIVSDTSIPFTDRLRELKKAQADATVIAQTFGVENAAGANILLDSIDAQEELKKKINGTNTAAEQAAVIMDTYSEKMSRMNAWFSDLGITIFNATENALPFVKVMGDVAFTGSQLGTVFSGLGPVMGSFNNTTLKPLGNRLRKVRLQSLLTGISFKSLGLSGLLGAIGAWTLTGSIKALSMAIKSIPVIGWILAIVGALITLFSYLWSNSEKFRGFIYATWNVIKLVFGKVWAFISPILDWIGEKFVSVFYGIWTTIKTVFGNVWGFLKSAFSFIKGIVSNALGTISGVFSNIFGGMYDTVVEVFKKMWKKIKYYIDLITKPIKVVGGFIAKMWGEVTGSDFAGEVADAVDEGYDKANKEFDEKDKIGNPVKEAIEATTKTKERTKQFEKGTAPKLDGNNNNSTATGNGGGSGSSSGSKTVKALNVQLTVNNNIAVKDGSDFMNRKDEILTYIVGRINDTMKDALIAAT